MPDRFLFDVFLSHNAKDKSRVRRLAERLKQAGLRVWLDEWNVRSGDIIALKVDEGLEQSRVLVLCMSSNALASRWVDLERSTVIHRDPANGGRCFIPLLLDDCDLPDSLRRYKYVDYRNESAAAFSELVSTIKDDSAESPATPSLESIAPSLPTPQAPAVRKPSNSKRTVRVARPTPWEKVAPFAALTFASFLCGVGLLILMLWNAERLVALGLVGDLYYIVLLPLALAAAGFLFGVLRSYARYTGKQLGGTLELGGPIVAFALVVIGGFYVPKPVPESFDVTVLVRGEKSSNDLILRNSGTVWMTLGSDRRNEKIGDKGQADFKNIPARFRGQEVPISVEADGLEPAKPEATYRLDTGGVNVVLKRQPIRVSGRVQDDDGNPVADASVRIADLQTNADAGGHFVFNLTPETPSDSVKAEVSAPGFEIWRGQLKPNGGEAAIVLKRNQK